MRVPLPAQQPQCQPAPGGRRGGAIARAHRVICGVVIGISFIVCGFLRSPRLCRLGGGHGGYRLLGAGEVGAADPDRGDVDGQGEQRDPGGDQERAGEPGGEGMLVDRCGQRPARVYRVSGPSGNGGGVGGLGVDAVGGDGPGDGAEQRQAEGAADLLAGVEQAGGDAGVGFGDAVERDRDSVTNSRAVPAPMTMVGPSTPLV